MYQIEDMVLLQGCAHLDCTVCVSSECKGDVSLPQVVISCVVARMHNWKAIVTGMT